MRYICGAKLLVLAFGPFWLKAPFWVLVWGPFWGNWAFGLLLYCCFAFAPRGATLTRRFAPAMFKYSASLRLVQALVARRTSVLLLIRSRARSPSCTLSMLALRAYTRELNLERSVHSSCCALETRAGARGCLEREGPKKGLF
jgi:hypothetical protein